MGLEGYYSMLIILFVMDNGDGDVILLVYIQCNPPRAAYLRLPPSIHHDHQVVTSCKEEHGHHLVHHHRTLIPIY